MAKITKKIMAFVGTEEASGLVNALAQYTDNIYAAVASEYGSATHPGGNITLLSKYMDAEKIESWIDRVGIDIIIDGSAITAEKEHSIIKNACEKKNVEYMRIASEFSINLNTEICRTKEELLRNIEYSVGKVLVKGDEDVCRMLTEARDFKERLILLMPPETDRIRQALDSGYSMENIVCIGRILSRDFLISLFNEMNISHFVMMGSEIAGMPQRLDAVDHSSVKASVFGEIAKDEGMSADSIWDIFVQRFGIED